MVAVGLAGVLALVRSRRRRDAESEGGGPVGIEAVQDVAFTQPFPDTASHLVEEGVGTRARVEAAGVFEPADARRTLATRSDEDL